MTHAEAPEPLAQAIGACRRLDAVHGLEGLITTRNVYGLYTGQFHTVRAAGRHRTPCRFFEPGDEHLGHNPRRGPSVQSRRDAGSAPRCSAATQVLKEVT